MLRRSRGPWPSLAQKLMILALSISLTLFSRVFEQGYFFPWPLVESDEHHFHAVDQNSVFDTPWFPVGYTTSLLPVARALHQNNINIVYSLFAYLPRFLSSDTLPHANNSHFVTNNISFVAAGVCGCVLQVTALAPGDEPVLDNQETWVTINQLVDIRIGKESRWSPV